MPDRAKMYVSALDD